MKFNFICVCAFLFLSSSVFEGLLAQQSGYKLPPQAVVDIIDAAPEPGVSFSPDGQWMMLIDRDAMPAIEDVARRMLQLAGLRIDPDANGRFETSFNKGLTLRRRDADPNDKSAQTKIELPANAKISRVSWSHNSRNFAFSIVTDQGQQLWAASVDAPKPRLLNKRLNTVTGGFQWMPNGSQILCQLVPDNRGDEPQANRRPTGPNIQESSGNKSPTRTYQDLLQNPYDEALFEFYTTTQLAVIDMDGNTRKLGEPKILTSVDASPSGQYVLVTTIEKPFSYLMTYRSFPRKIQVWKIDDSADGPDVHIVADLPMDENIPIEGVRMGPRDVEWKSSVPATLVWTEALDGGDPNRKVDHRDRYLAQAAPFTDLPAEMLKVQHRASGMSYFSDPSLVITTEYDRDRRWIRSLMHDLKMPGTTPKTLMDRSIRDSYGDPGRIVNIPDETGHSVARQDGDWIYRAGRGASSKGTVGIRVGKSNDHATLPLIRRANDKKRTRDRSS